MGGFGLFQKLATLLNFAGLYSFSLFWMSIPFFELSPEYLCTRVDELGNFVTESCSAKLLCATNDYVSYTIKESDQSLINWN
jgi:hypothetical protein